MKTTVTRIRKRDGSAVRFSQDKITHAIWKAAHSVGGKDRKLAQQLSEEVVRRLDKRYDGHSVPSIEDIQDIVEQVLIEKGHARTAKAYILYRQQRKYTREQARAILGMETKTTLSLNALRVLKERILLKDERGNLTETPDRMFWRVAKDVAKADKLYDKKADTQATAQEFHDLMADLDFLPNSPTLMNAGTDVQQLTACFALPVPDSIEGIFDTLRQAAIIHKSGAGTGFSFSRLRPKDDYIAKTQSQTSGPVSFMHVFDAATNVMKQGGRKRGANMAMLRVDHPDILEFIAAKEDHRHLTNFNISVGITKAFMDAVRKGKEYPLINPRTGRAVNKLRARHVFELLSFQAWKSGEPGVLFLDAINASNPTPGLGKIEATDSCAGQPLLPYEACGLGSVNLARMVVEGEIDFAKLRRTVRSAVHFLDNVIDVNRYPLPQTEAICKGNRKIGLGVMGFADMLIQLKIPYDSKEAVRTAESVMRLISQEARKMSQELAKRRGVFPNWKKSIWAKRGLRLRNATCTTISPTGTISLIADVSAGIEPNIALCYTRNVLGRKLLFVNRYLEATMCELGIYSEALLEKMKDKASAKGIAEIPAPLRKVFITAMDISPEWHVRVQAAFQKHTDNAISKTINFPHEAQIEAIGKAYQLAYKLGCKGITVYRDRSRQEQLMSFHQGA